MNKFNNSKMQNPNTCILLPPNHFSANKETAVNNHFQAKNNKTIDLNSIALSEHNQLVDKLKLNDINCFLLKDKKDIKNPDALFLNNWFSITTDQKLVIYPMWAKNRRSEIQSSHIDTLIAKFKLKECIDFSDRVNENKFCEGTGSIIFDQEQKKSFACISARTSVELFEYISIELGYAPISFEAIDLNGKPIYHTNVMLSIGENIVVICSEAIVNPIERIMVKKALAHKNRVIIDITLNQVKHFCGNVLEVNTNNGNPCLLMSKNAFDHFTFEQKTNIEERCTIIYSELTTIEKYGGGSMRCLIAGCDYTI